jgi:hypothetical protein
MPILEKLQVLSTTQEEQPLEAASRHCDCGHEKLSDGIHHYLELSGSTDGDDGKPLAIDETLESKEGTYIAVVYSEGASYCFMKPTWAASFRGPSEAGEIPPSLRLLCDWCKRHWSSAPDVNFRSL